MGSITDATLLHHVGIVLISLWLLNSYDYSHPVAYFISLIYLYIVHEGYVLKLRKRLQFEEKRDANQRRVLLDSETVRWLNHAVEKMWLVCMEEIVSQKILLPIAPWFLKKYKPWTAKEIEIQHFYLGRSPPIFTEIRVLQNSNSDDHLVLEIGMNFRTADDMTAILGVKLRKRLGFGMWAKLHLLGMHIEGKVLVGVKFLPGWPFIGRLRVCFASPPYFQMTVKPIFTHGLDVTEVPGISGWIDNLLAVVFEQTLVEPNMLVVDVEKFVSPQPENSLSVDAKKPVAHAIVEVLEGAEMKPSDLNGLADPYVKGKLGSSRFQTKIQKKTLAPKWLEEFKIPVFSWDSLNILVLEVCDKDHVFDDVMGDCCLKINELRDGQRHDIWLPLQNIKMGRLHVAVTVIEVNGKEEYIRKHARGTGVKVKLRLRHGKAKFGKGLANFIGAEPVRAEGPDSNHKRVSFEANPTSTQLEAAQKGFDVLALKDTSEKYPKVADKFEPVAIGGQEDTGIWIQHPGSNVGPVWEPRKGNSSSQDSHNLSTPGKGEGGENDGSSSSSSSDECTESNKQYSRNRVRRGLRKISSIFHKEKGPGAEDNSHFEPLPRDNIEGINAKKAGVTGHVPRPSKSPKDDEKVCLDENGSEGQHGNVKHAAKSILKQAGKSARELKFALSRKRSRKHHTKRRPLSADKDVHMEPNASDNDTISSSSLSSLSSADNVIAETGLLIPGSAVRSPSGVLVSDPAKSEDVVQEANLSPVSSSDSFKSKDAFIHEAIPSSFSVSDSFKSKDFIGETNPSGGSSVNNSLNSQDNVILQPAVSANTSFEPMDTIQTSVNRGDCSSKSFFQIRK